MVFCSVWDEDKRLVELSGVVNHRLTDQLCSHEPNLLILFGFACLIQRTHQCSGHKLLALCFFGLAIKVEVVL